MNEIIRLDSLEDYGRDLGGRIRHPLVDVVDFSLIETLRHGRRNYGFYAVLYKESACGNLSYGRSNYDYREGTFVFIAPGQVAGVDDGGGSHHQSQRTRPRDPSRPVLRNPAREEDA